MPSSLSKVAGMPMSRTHRRCRWPRHPCCRLLRARATWVKSGSFEHRARHHSEDAQAGRGRPHRRASGRHCHQWHSKTPDHAAANLTEPVRARDRLKPITAVVPLDAIVNPADSGKRLFSKGDPSSSSASAPSHGGTDPRATVLAGTLCRAARLGRNRSAAASFPGRERR